MSFKLNEASKIETSQIEMQIQIWNTKPNLEKFQTLVY